MGERLSRGARIHNRREKAAARAEHRIPNLIRPALPIESHPMTVRHERPVRRKASFEEIMTAGRRLSRVCQGFDLGDRRWEYISDRDAISILDDLAIGIQSGRILSQEAIACQVGRLGPKIGPMGSVSTGIDEAALSVLDTMKANRDKLTK